MRKTLDRILEGALVLIMSLLVLTVVWQVFTRYVLMNPSTFTDELARFLLIWLSLLGGTYMVGKNGHVAIDLLPQALPLRGRLWLKQSMRLLVVAFVFGVFVIGGGHLVWITWTLHQISPALQVPVAFVYAMGPLSGLLMIYYQIADMCAPELETVIEEKDF
ncbi:MAG: TRAP transporter small permease [Opitutales bacterium]|nr:TRAP transporter small permease [Opitutales bacterium]